MSRTFYGSSVLYDKKNSFENMKDFAKRKLMFSRLATPEIQVPIRLIDAYWSGNKKFQLNSKIFKINGNNSKRLSWKGFDWWFFFWMVFSPLHWEKKRKKRRDFFYFYFWQRWKKIWQKIATSMKSKYWK